MSKFTFNASEHPQETYETIAPGWYHASIVQSEIRTSNNPGVGEMLAVTLEIDPNEHSDIGARKVTTFFCTKHHQEKVALIARSKLAKLLTVIGKPVIEDSSDLLGSRLIMKLSMGKGGNGYEPRAEYADCKPHDAEVKTGAAPSEAPKTAAQPAARKSWR